MSSRGGQWQWVKEEEREEGRDSRELHSGAAERHREAKKAKGREEERKREKVREEARGKLEQKREATLEGNSWSAAL